MINNDLICSDLFKYGSLCIDLENDNNVPEFIIDSWSKAIIDDKVLYIHPEEKFSVLEFDDYKIYIIGDIYSINNHYNIDEILISLVMTKKWDDIDYLSGRFNVYVFGKENFVFSDPLGSKSIYYSINGLVVSNHSTLVAMIINHNVSKEILGYKKSYEYNLKGTKFLPGDLTMFDGVYGLSPNNLFDIDEKNTKRFYFFENIQKTTLNHLKITVFDYFKEFSNYIKLCGYTPVLGLTAGVDTRLVIAALKFFDINFELVTWSRGVSNEENELISEISKYLDKPHYYIDTTNKVIDSEVIKLSYISNYNTGFSRGNCQLTAQFKEVFNNSDKKYIFIRGLGGEIMRGMFNFSRSSKQKLSRLEYAEHLYNTHALTKVKLSQEYDSFTKKSLFGFFERGNINLLNETVDIGDVIYWEQRMGRWAAELHNENDASMKNFSGINSRLIYKLSFGLDSDIRYNRDLLIKLTKVFDDKLADFKYI